MHATGKQLLNLMFRPGERVCCSLDQFGYHSVTLETALSDNITLVSPNNKVQIKTVKTDDLTLVALNPMKHGFRTDENCATFRNFLIEMDSGALTEQFAYIKKMGLPYSAIVFSGNKSLHFLVSLDTDLPSEKVYRTFAEWILNTITLADQATKNPSRSIRIPGALRDTGKRQELQEFNGPVKMETLADWLKKHPDAKPKEKQERKISGTPDFGTVKGWAKVMVKDGISAPNRNRKWFSVAVEFALSGFDEEYTIKTLRQYYSEERDFKEREWEATIKSAFKWAHEKRG